MTLRDQQPPQEDPTDLAHRLAALLEQYPEERQGAQRALQGTLSGEENNAPLRTAQKLSEIPAEYPAPILESLRTERSSPLRGPNMPTCSRGKASERVPSPRP